MTVAATPYKESYAGNGVTTVFSVPFYFLADTDLVVSDVNTLVTPNVITPLVLNVGYTVTGTGTPTGGAVTVTTATATGHTLTIERSLVENQPTHFVDGDPLPASGLEQALDRIVMLYQQAKTALDRAAKFAVGSPSSSDLPEPQEGYVLGWVSGKLKNLSAATAQLAADLLSAAVGKGAALLVYMSPLTGAVVRTLQQIFDGFPVKPEWFGAVGDGVTDDTAAIEKAGQALVSGSTLEFGHNKTYLISYIWTANTDTMPSEPDGVGRGRGVLWLHDKTNITIKGNGSTIKCVNHDIAAKGGLAFLYARRMPNLTVDGLRFDMTFTGYKDSASFYPMCGGLIVTDNPNPAGSGTQAALCSNFVARNIWFKLYHPNGCFAITSHPYGGDSNNGFKIIAIFAAGDTSSSTTYASRNRGLLMENIRFAEGHNGYGCWAFGYDDMVFRNIHAEAWVAASYTIATLTYTGTSFISPVRVYQYYGQGLEVDGVFVRSLPQASRTGAFQGVCGGVTIFSGVGTLTTGGAIVTNCEFILDSPATTLGGNSDRGIQSDLNGQIAISKCKFRCHQQSGVTCIQASGGDNATGVSTYTVSDCHVDTTCNGPFFQLANGSNTAAANRTIKAAVLSNNVVRGFGAEGAVQSYTSGYTYHGSESLIVSKNVFDARGSLTAVYAVVDPTATSTDNIISTDNAIFAPAAHNLGTAAVQPTTVVRDNVVNGATQNSSNNAINFQTNNYWQWQTFAAAQAVAMTIATGDYNQYSYIEYDSTGLVKFFKSGIANSGTGTIRTVATGNTGQLTYMKLGSLR